MKRLVYIIISMTLLLTGGMPFAARAETAIEGPVTVPAGPVGNWVRDTPRENLFRLEPGGEEFVLLDSDSSNAASAFYVLAESLYGTMYYDTSPGAGKPYDSVTNPNSGQKFDPSSATNIAQWLNGPFAQEGNVQNGVTRKLPQAILDNLDRGHVWRTECGDDSTNCSQQLCGGNKYYDVTAGITLMSMHEFQAYAGKFGVLDKDGDLRLGGNGNGWWLRTCNRDGVTILRHVSALPGSLGVWNNGAAKPDRMLGVRPQFYLGRDFFQKVKIDPYYLGKNVKEAIAATCTKADLEALSYTADEIASIMDTAINSDNRITLAEDSSFVAIDGAPSVKVKIGNMQKDAQYVIRYSAPGIAEQAFNFPMDYAETEEKTCTFAFPEAGVYTAQITVLRNGEQAAAFSPQVAFIQSTEAAGRYDFLQKGAATHYSFGNTELNDVAYLKACGIQTVRDEILWKSVERTAGVYDFTYFDSYINALTQNGISFIAILGYENALYCEGAPEDARSLEGFAKYAAAVAKHYPMIQRFEIWNEPDLAAFWGREPNAAEYAALVRAASEQIKKVRPDAEIFGGVTTCASFDYMTQLMNLGMYACVDGISFHPYVHPQKADSGTIERMMQGNMQLADDSGGFKPVGISETGWSTDTGSRGSDEAKQAAETVKELVLSDEQAMRFNMIYDFRNDGMDPGNMEHNFGLLKKDFMPKLAYFAFQNFNNTLHGAKYCGKIQITDKINGYVYNRQGMPIVVAWGKGDGNPLPADTAQEIRNLYGKTTTADVIGTQPVYLLGMDRSVLTRSIANTAQKAFSKLNSTVVPKLADTVSSANFIQMLNA